MNEVEKRTKGKKAAQRRLQGTVEKPVKKNKRCCGVRFTNQMDTIQTKHKKWNDEKEIDLAQSSGQFAV